MVFWLVIPEMGFLVEELSYKVFRKDYKLKREWLWGLISLVCIHKEH